MTFSKSKHSSGDPAKLQPLLEVYAPGTRHSIRYNPADPDHVEFDAGYDLATFWPIFFFGGLGLLAVGFGIHEWISWRRGHY